MTWHEILHTIIINIKSILRITALSTLFLFLILFFVYPRTYNAVVTILPPEKNSSVGGLSSLLANQDLSGLLTGNLSNANAQIFAEILKSRSAALYVLDKLKIQDKYDEDDRYEAARKLSEDLNIDINKENFVKVSVDVKSKYFPMLLGNEEGDKKLSADISNGFIEALDKINRQKLSSKSKRARIYIESQLIETKIKLDSVENALMLFQKKNKAISIPDQLKTAFESAAKIKTEIVKAEMELGLLKYNVQDDNRTYQSLKKKLEQLQEQYDKMEVGSQDYLMAFKDIPELGKELAGLYRDTKIFNEVYMLLQQQYYKEKIQENRDLPTVEVLDEAIPPTQKSSPKVIYSTFSGSFFIFIIISFYYLILYIKKKNFS
jgi:tyrosine-protein kinase Etk/Wzc